MELLDFAPVGVDESYPVYLADEPRLFFQGEEVASIIQPAVPAIILSRRLAMEDREAAMIIAAYRASLALRLATHPENLPSP